MRKSLLPALSLSFLTSMASASVIVAQNPSNPEVQQNGQNPCVIGDHPCKTGSLPGKTLVPNSGNATSFDLFSPVYSVAQVLAVTNNVSFSMGLDLNNTNDPQTVNFVGMYVNTGNGFQLIDSWNPATPLTTKALGNNGSGYSDITFQGFSLSGFQQTDQVKFRLYMSVINDGPESFFLIGNAGSTEAPEPSTSALVGGALLTLAGLMRRKRA